MKSAEVKPTTTAKKGSGKPFFTGAGEAVQEKQGRTPFFNSGSGGAREGIQTKLSIGKQGDSYEREADMMAERCVNRQSEIAERNNDMSPVAEGGNQQAAAPQVQAKCAKCEEGQQSGGAHRCAECEAEAQNKVQRSAAGMVVESKHSEDIESRLHSSKGGGSPLPAKTRERMESSLGADFSGVRVHTDGEAAEMNGMLNAHAFTHGGDIYFNRGKYDPNHPEGQRLLAHELTHTVQQGAAAPKNLKGPEPELKEAEAEKSILPRATPGIGNNHANHAKQEEGARRGEEAKKAVEAKKAEGAKEPEESHKKHEVDKAKEAINGEEKEGGGEDKEGGAGKASAYDKAGEHGAAEHGAKAEPGKKGEKGKAHVLPSEAPGEGATGSPAAGPSPAPMGSNAAKSATDLAKANQSRAKLGLVEKDLAALGAGRPEFALAAKEAKNPALLQQKLQCDDSVFLFLNESASLVHNLMAPGAQITAAINSGAAAAKAMVNAESQRQQALANSEIRRLKKQAEAKAWGVIGGINAKHQQTVAKLNADAQAAKAKVLVTHTVAAGLLEINVAAQLPQIDRIYNEAADKFRKAGVKAGDHAVDIANKKADYYAGQAKDWYEMYDDDQAEGILDGPVTARQYDAREEAAREVGKQYRDGDTGLVKEGQKQADQLLNGPGKSMDLQKVNDIATKSRNSLAQTYDAALKGIDAFTSQAIKNAGMAKQSLIAAAHNELKATLHSLDQQLATQKKMLASYSQSLADRIDGEAVGSITSLTDALAEAAGALAGALAKFKSEIGGRPVPDMANLQALLGQMKVGIVSAGGAMQASLNSGLTQSVSSLIKGGGVAKAELKDLADGGLAEMRKTCADLQPVLARLASSAVSVFNKVEKESAKGLDQTVAKATAGFLNISAGINQAFAQLNAQLTKVLADSVTQIDASFIAAVDNNIGKVITDEAQKAADKVKPRWKKILKVLLIIAVIVVVVLVAGPAVVMFATGAAGALGAGAAATAIGTVVGGAVVGAASSAAIQVISNAFDGLPLMDGVIHAAVIGGLTGALGAGAGLLGGKLVGIAAQRGWGAFAQFGVKIGTNLAVDFAGNVAIEFTESRLAHRAMSWGNVGIQMVMSLATNLGMEGLGKFKAIGGIQQWAARGGAKLGVKLGGKLNAALGRPEFELPRSIAVMLHEPGQVKTTEPGEVKAPEQGETKAAEPEKVKTPESGETKTPGAGESKPPEPGETKAPEPAEGKTPEAGEGKTPEHAEGKTPEGGDSKSREAGEGKIPESEADKFVKGSHPTGDGHEIKVLEDGRIIRCSPTCEELASRFAKELNGSRKLQAELDEITKIEDPKAKARAAAEFDQKIKNRLIEEYRARIVDGISDERIGDYIDQGYRLNPETGRFKNSNGLDLVPAEFHERLGGREGTKFDPENFDAATKRNLKAGVEERAAAKAQKDRTRTPEGYEAADKRMRGASEQLGNEATDGVMKKFGKKNGIGDAEFTGDGRNALDKIYPVKNGGKWVAEAKGPNGQLRTKIGTIPGYKGKILEQGTEPYLRQTLEEMRLRGERTGDTRLVDLANDTLKALNKGKVRYFMVSQPVDAAGELLPTQLREFKID
jgi:Domain of unknown function (DUF4157)/Cornifin (SPRR) family